MVIVDDDAAFATALVAMLEQEDRVQVVGTASDGREALAAVERLRPDAVTMDLDMPVLDGIEATRLIARDHPSVAIVVVTASTSGTGAREALALGAAAHVAKGDVSERLVPALLAATTPAAVRERAPL